MSLLTLRGLHVSYGGAPVLRGASLAVERGRTTALIGTSGSGKSTLLHALLGLLPPAAHVTAEEATFDGIPLLPKHGAPLLGRRMGCVFQDPRSSLTPHLRAKTQIAESLSVAGIRATEHPLRIRTLLGELGFPDPERAAEAFPHELSGGLCQRLALAIAVAGNPDLLIADEPTTALDVTIQLEVLKLLRDLCERRKLATLLVTHDLRVVAALADTVFVLHEGAIVESGLVGEVLRKPSSALTGRLIEGGLA